MIYFLGTTATATVTFRSTKITGDLIKIGSSHNPIARLRYLKNQHQQKGLILLGVMPGGVLSEKKLHKRFRHLQVTYGNLQKVEWFYRSDEILEFIAANTSLDMSIKERSPLGLVTHDSLVMLVEFAAQRAGVSVDQYIEASLRLKLENDGLPKHPAAGSPQAPNPFRGLRRRRTRIS